jgi:hypothetical protein
VRTHRDVPGFRVGLHRPLVTLTSPHPASMPTYFRFRFTRTSTVLIFIRADGGRCRQGCLPLQAFSFSPICLRAASRHEDVERERGTSSLRKSCVTLRRGWAGGV